MFDNHAGYTESPEKIEARKRRILGTRVLPPMTRSQWNRMPAAFKFFCPWEVASKPLTILIDREV